MVAALDSAVDAVGGEDRRFDVGTSPSVGGESLGRPATSERSVASGGHVTSLWSAGMPSGLSDSCAVMCEARCGDALRRRRSALALLDVGPLVAQADGAVEPHRIARVEREVAEALELDDLAGRRVAQGGFDLAVDEYLA